MDFWFALPVLFLHVSMVRTTVTHTLSHHGPNNCKSYAQFDSTTCTQLCKIIPMASYPLLPPDCAWQLNRTAYRPCTACGIVSYSKTGTNHDSAAYLFSALNLEGLHLSWAAWTCYLSLHLLPICIQEYIYVDAQEYIYSTYKSDNVNVKHSPGCQSTKACYSKLMYNSVVSVGHSLRLHLWKDMKNEVWLMKAFEQKYYCYSCRMISHLRRKGNTGEKLQ